MSHACPQCSESVRSGNSENSAFDEFTQKKFIEDQKTIMELSGRLQELQNEVNCMNDSKDFQDAESVRSGMEIPTLPVNQCLSQHIRYLKGMLRPSFVSPRRKEGPPNMWDTQVFRETFLQIHMIFISSLSSRIESMGYDN